jgi:acyl-CoA thioesterase
MSAADVASCANMMPTNRFTVCLFPMSIAFAVSTSGNKHYKGMPRSAGKDEVSKLIPLLKRLFSSDAHYLWT